MGDSLQMEQAGFMSANNQSPRTTTCRRDRTIVDAFAGVVCVSKLAKTLAQPVIPRIVTADGALRQRSLSGVAV